MCVIGRSVFCWLVCLPSICVSECLGDCVLLHFLCGDMYVPRSSFCVRVRQRVDICYRISMKILSVFCMVFLPAELTRFS